MKRPKTNRHEDNRPKKTKPSKNARAAHLPQRNEILHFIAENPNKTSKRELAKAFNLKGEARVWLKDLLRQLSNEGIIEKKRKMITKRDALPPVTVVEIFGRDHDGLMLARPVDWPMAQSANHDHSQPPNIEIRPSRTGKAPIVEGRIGVGDRVVVKIFRNKNEEGPDWIGKIIKKQEKRSKTVLGVLGQTDSGEWRLRPIDRRDGEVVLDKNTPLNANQGDLVEAELIRDSRYGLKRGIVRTTLGHIESEKALSMIAILAHDIPHIFPQNVIEQAEKTQPTTLKNREDWRDRPFVTIDPQDAKDHDDAVFAMPDSDPANKGGCIITVAIADVACYVHRHSAMDQEAFKRSNSVYFPDRVVPMLPERISNNLCSLREHEDRPALAVKMIFDANGAKKSHHFYRVMVRSIAKLSYQQAQNGFDGKFDEKTKPLLKTVLQPLWSAYKILKQNRKKRQPLNLDLPEKKIILDENGRIKDVIVPERLEAHKLIEEFMIQANVCAAETLHAKHHPLLYRNHDHPSLAKQESLREFLQTLGITLAKGGDLTAAKINTILDKVANTNEQELVNQVILRSQSQAEYHPENIGHFGLNLKNYTHFTSPIRRYADLVVHRGLITALDLGDDGLTTDEQYKLEDIAAQISTNERRAMAAERATVDRLVAHYLANKIGAHFEGRITGVTKAGLFVALKRFGADGFIPIATLKDDYYHFDEVRHSLAGHHNKKGYQLGDIVQVNLLEALPIAGALRFEMLSPPHPLSFSPISYHKGRRHSTFKQKKQPARRRSR